MFYALFNSKKLIGIFDTKEGIDNMINGLKQNNLCNNLTVKKYIKNSICRVKDNMNNNISNNNISIDNISSDIKKLTPEEEKKIIKEKSELEYELVKLKKQQDNIKESKKTYTVDLDLYNKFKKIKEENNDFVIPELFIEKYSVFELIENEGNLNWENFYANYKQKNLSSSYSNMFDNGDARCG
jgi:hypothetical protein